MQFFALALNGIGSAVREWLSFSIVMQTLWKVRASSRNLFGKAKQFYCRKLTDGLLAECRVPQIIRVMGMLLEHPT